MLKNMPSGVRLRFRRDAASRVLVAAICLLLGASIAKADSSSSTMVVYGVDASNSPKRSIWSGSAWGSSASLSSVGAQPHWMVLRNCPTRNEMACGTFDASSDVNVMFYNGSSWTGVTEVNTEGDENDDRNFDIAYEQTSGDCLIVYYDLGENNFGYRTYNGSTLSSETDLSRSNLDGNDYVALYPKPNSNQIVMITIGQVNGSDAISANIWNGSSWGGWTTILSGMSTNDNECASFAFESNSGHGLLVYGEAGQNSPRYRTINGTTWSSQSSMPSIGGVAWWVKLASDPNSNQILCACLDDQNDINTNAWNGSSWGSDVEVESNAPAYDKRCFDVAYEPEGTKALVAYVESGQNSLRYRTWGGSSWSSESTGTDLGAQGRTVQLRTGSASREIFIAATDDTEDVELMRWNGSMSSKTRIEDNMGALAQCESFMIATPTESGLVPANIPYTKNFEGTVGSEWSNSTVSNTATFSNFLGNFNGTKVRLALNTTIGETYALTFDLYTIDSWDGNDPTYGPDSFIVSVDNTDAFNYTFCANNPSYGQTYPYPYDQVGAYGFGASFNDGIYRTVEVDFVATSSVTTLSFSDQLTDTSPGISNESWGIDNVKVATAPFVDVSSAKGFDVTNTSDASTYGGGMVWADFTKTGTLDCFMSGNTARLLKNNSAGASFTSTSMGDLRKQAVLVDMYNDGDIDLWIPAATGPDTERCMANNGSGTLASVGNLGFSSPTGNEAAAAADLNANGWCDIVMFSDSANWIGQHNGSASSPALSATSSSTYGLNTSGNYGDGDYCSSGDVNNDGRLDFFYHYGSGKLFVSNGDGTYTRSNYNISVTTGTSLKFGSTWGDYDNDGDLDLFCPRMSESCSGYLWRNDRNWTSGSGNFTNVTSSAGLNMNTVIDYMPDLPGTRSAAWGDYDNDGDLDLFILGAEGAHYLYQNQGNGTFKRVANGVTSSGEFVDCCFVDYDNDGDLDLALTRENGTALLYKNRTDNSNYLKVRVVGRGAGGTNTAGIGTRVELWNSAGTTLLARRDVGVARGFGGAEPLWVHFGGVTPSTSYTVKAYFNSSTSSQTVKPNAVSTTIGSRTISQMLTITESTKASIVRWYEVPNHP